MIKLSQYTSSVFDQLRTRQDPLADQAATVLVANPDLSAEINSWQHIPNPLPSHFPAEVQCFFEIYLHKEKEFSLETYRPAQEYFERNGDLYLALLGFYSLPYCYAFADGAQVLVRSKRILEQVGERLGETTRFVLELFRPGAFTSQDGAFLSCAKVRLIHAYSRYFIHAHAKDWSSDFGAPINQEDLIGTNLAFSHIVMRGMTKLELPPSEKEHEAVLLYWKWIGDLMGLETEVWPTHPKEAFELDKLIRKRHLRTSEAGQKLLRALLHFYTQNIPDPLLSSQLESILAFFLGKEAAAALGVNAGLSLPGKVLGGLLKYAGSKNLGGKKGHAALQKSIDNQQLLQFGRILQLQLPDTKRP